MKQRAVLNDAVSGFDESSMNDCSCSCFSLELPSLYDSRHLERVSTVTTKKLSANDAGLPGPHEVQAEVPEGARLREPHLQRRVKRSCRRDQ